MQEKNGIGDSWYIFSILKFSSCQPSQYSTNQENRYSSHDINCIRHTSGTTYIEINKIIFNCSFGPICRWWIICKRLHHLTPIYSGPVSSRLCGLVGIAFAPRAEGR